MAGNTTKPAKPLKVKMFGEFVLNYNDEDFVNKRAGENQFNTLMEMMIFHNKNGISKEKLEEVIFADRKLGDVHHAMQSVLYNAKKRLEQNGLPKIKYFVLKKGVYYWNKEIPLQIDVSQFLSLADKAGKVEDEYERMRYISEYCYLYKGAFLSEESVQWAVAPAEHYLLIFRNGVKVLAEYLRGTGDYMEMEALGRHASKVDPFNDWETITMEALMGLGRYDEARDFYAETVELYYEKKNLRPSDELDKFLEKLVDNMYHDVEILDVIQNRLIENEIKFGGYICSFPVFRGIYQMVRRMLERGGQAQLVLCNLVDSSGNIVPPDNISENLSGKLGDAIRSSIRKGDVITKYGEGQYLVILINTSREDCSRVQDRIDRKFAAKRSRYGIKYYVNPVLRD